MKRALAKKSLYRSVSVGAVIAFCAACGAALLAPAGAARADEVATAETSDSASTDQIQTITILSSGSTRQTQSIDSEVLREDAPGTSVLKALGLLPGVNFTDSDSFGAYEWAARVSVRGFSTSELGYTLDGIPLGDMSYGNWNGLHISRAIIQNDIATTSISQGAGALSTASNSNLGGTIQFISKAPADKFGVTAEQGLGSFDSYRSYVRLDSGLLDSGTKFEVSGDYSHSETWKGALPQYYAQLNGRVEQKINDNNTLTAFWNYSDRHENDYQDLSLYYLKTLGSKLQNFTDWGVAVAASRGNYPPSLQNIVDPGDASYAGSSGIRTDQLGGAFLQSQLTSALSVKNTAYYHTDYGQGAFIFGAPAAFPDPTGSKLWQRDSQYKQVRYGLLSDWTLDLDRNTVTAGAWLGNEYFHWSRQGFTVSDSVPQDALLYRTDPYVTLFESWFHTTIVQGYVQDSVKITDKLTVSAGFKGTRTDTMNDPISTLASPLASGHLITASPFLPQAGVNWTITPGDEIFGDVAENIKTFGYSPFQVSQAAFNTTPIKPESSVTEEAGYRLKRGPLDGTLVLYHTDFSNRLLSTNPCPAVTQNILPGCYTSFHNVGSVSTNGVELSSNWRIIPGLNWYNGFTYNRSTYGSDYLSGGVPVAIKGKTVVDTPDVTYKTEISYRWNEYFANLTGNVTSKRYFTYTNDQSVPSYKVFDLALGYDAENVSHLSNLRFQLNINNLFQEKYISTLGTNGFGASGDNQTLQVGAPRSYFMTVSTKF
jgi:iron complex outermembrane receptor protein